MAHKGRDLERFLRILESGLANSDVTVTSPDFIEDEVTHKKREVDVSIRNKTGAILAIIECRARKEKDDVTWIEQLATKMKDAHIPKTIVVSSSGFSKAARMKAQHYGIELRTVAAISNEELRNWLIPSSLIKIIQNHSIISMTLISDNPRFQTIEIPFDPNVKYFRRGQRYLSANDLFNLIPNVSAYYPPEDEQRHLSRTLRLDLRKHNFEFHLDVSGHPKPARDGRVKTSHLR